MFSFIIGYEEFSFYLNDQIEYFRTRPYRGRVHDGPRGGRHGDPRGDPLRRGLCPNRRSARTPRWVPLPTCGGDRTGQCPRIPTRRDGHTRCGDRTRGDVCLRLIMKVERERNR